MMRLWKDWLSTRHRGTGRRGTIMIVFVFLVPMAVMGVLMALTQLDIAFSETQRHRDRVQARLLAESAWAVAGALGSGAPREGIIDGAGTWRIEPAAGGSGLWRFTGEVEGRQARMTAIFAARREGATFVPDETEPHAAFLRAHGPDPMVPGGRP
jgi:hypothetical protein